METKSLLSNAKRVYTTHEAARLLGVTPITIIRWTEKGKLKCFLTLGGHRRIYHEELGHFAEAHHLPWSDHQEIPEKQTVSVLTVSPAGNLENELRQLLGASNLFYVTGVKDAFSLGVQLMARKTDAVFIDFSSSFDTALQLCRSIREDRRFHHVPLVAVAEPAQVVESAGLFRSIQGLLVLTRPLTRESFLEKIPALKRAQLRTL